MCSVRKEKEIKTLRAMAIALVFIAAGPRPAMADFYCNLTNPDPGVKSFTGPYIGVSVALTGQTAVITFSSPRNGGDTHLMGEGKTLALNISALELYGGGPHRNRLQRHLPERRVL